MAAAVPVFAFSPITKKYIRIPITAVLSDGTMATLTSIDVAVVPVGGTVSSSTTWTAVTLTAGVGKPLLAGPEADPTGAIPVPADGGDVFVRVTDSPEIDAVRLFRITVG